MRRLVLMRHAKAETYNISGDFDRELASRGRADAAAAGLALRDLGLTHALVSSAARTRQTYECLDLNLDVDYVRWLYLCGTSTMLNRIRELPDEVAGLLVVGHAPSIPNLAATLAFAAQPREADDIASWFPTSALVEFTFEGPWSELGEDDIELKQVNRVKA